MDHKESIRSQTMIMDTAKAQMITGLCMARTTGMQIQMMGNGTINDIKLKPVTTGNKQDTGKYDRKMRRRRRVRIRREAYRAIED